MTGAVADCERILEGFLAQPANAVTSLSFLGAAPLVWRSGKRGTAAALAATGIGSFLFHGPMPPGSQWAHDASLAWLLVAVGVAETRWEKVGGWPALAATGAVVAVLPDSADPLAGLTAAAAIASVLWRRRNRRTWLALGLLGLGAAVGRLSATGGPWCNPDTLLQGHSFWHLAAATSIVLWSRFYDQNGARNAPLWS
ncbi:MAG: hypothetical protein ACLFWM_03030 [Actinomycetota bacterium]